MGNPGTTPALYAARPRLSVDGTDVPDLADDLRALLVEETTAGLYRCEATFANWGPAGGSIGFRYLDRQRFDFGTALRVRAGSGEAEGLLFEGHVTALEAHYPARRPPEVTILAEDRLQDLRMTRRTRVFEDTSDADVFRTIAAAHSLRPDLDLDGPTHRVLAQVNQSDLAFLRERARAIDAEVWVEGATLHAGPRPRRGDEAIVLTYLEGLHEFQVLADLAGQRTSLAVSGWDVAAKEAVLHESDEAAIRSELNGFDSGAAVLRQAFGDRTERIVHTAPFTLEEARALAEAEFRTMARRFVTGHGLAEGDARLRAGARVDLRGLGRLFEGPYTLTAVQHTFDEAHGYRTRFTVERPGIHPA
ncbi:hypothetical protein AWN76_014655 [Rhodothermaceae bacterium RA]|nr:hypothetical protein AWN76_014655 [Rhodothermaceae bacterium RA]